VAVCPADCRLPYRILVLAGIEAGIPDTKYFIKSKKIANY
jgi:hypothetical protein